MTSSLLKLEKEKANRDRQLETLTEDLNNRDEAFAKLTKEKKNIDELLAEQINATQAEEDKVNHLSKAKKKLEETLRDVRNFRLFLYVFCCIQLNIKLPLLLFFIECVGNGASKHTSYLWPRYSCITSVP